MGDDWDQDFTRLRDSFALYHNRDYWEFLVRKVWRLDRACRLVDFGCGFGRIGLVLLPLLPEGSTYTGIDTSKVLLARGRELYGAQPYEATFVEADVHKAPFDDDSFDVAVSHTVLMHIPRAEQALAEMIRVTRPGGLVITCDANRNAFNAMFHVDETNEQERTPLELFQTINRTIRRQSGVDYNIGIKTPVLMHKAGLVEVGARISDAVSLLFPPLDTDEKKARYRSMCDEGFGHLPTDEEGIARWRRRLVDWGVADEDARREIERELDRDFAHKGEEYHTAFPGLLTFSYGRVPCDTPTDSSHAG